MTKLQERAIQAAEKFVTRRGMEALDTEWKSEDGGSVDLVAIDEDGTVVFVDVNVRQGIGKGLPSEDLPGARERMEVNGARYLAAREGDGRFVDVKIRFDIISMLVIGDDRASLSRYEVILSSPLDMVGMPACGKRRLYGDVIVDLDVTEYRWLVGGCAGIAIELITIRIVRLFWRASCCRARAMARSPVTEAYLRRRGAPFGIPAAH